MSSRRVSKQQAALQEAKLISDSKIVGNGLDLSPSKGPDASFSSVSAPFSWLKRCDDTLLERTHSNKKRKQQKEDESDDVPPLEETTDPWYCPMQSNSLVLTYFNCFF